MKPPLHATKMPEKTMAVVATAALVVAAVSHQLQKISIKSVVKVIKAKVITSNMMLPN